VEYHKSLTNVLGSISGGKHSMIAVWDIDNTLFTTPSNKLTIRVVDKKDNVLDSYTTQEFAEVTEAQKRSILASGKRFDFRDFAKSSIFKKYAAPIVANIRTALIEYNDPRFFFMVLTARGDMDDVKLFLSHFENYKLNMNRWGKSHIVRAGTIGLPKHEIMATVLKENKIIRTIKFYDDSSEEIRNFKHIRRDFPNTTFYANGDSV